MPLSPKVMAMIDFETLSLEHNAALISCGIVLFDQNGVQDTLYLNIVPHPEQHVSESTKQWWAEQSDEAQERLKENPVEFQKAMQTIVNFLRGVTVLWSHGATADIVWLKSALKLANLPMPVAYKGFACFRTAMNLKPNAEWVRPTVAHDALADAVAQTKTLLGAYGESLFDYYAF